MLMSLDSSSWVGRGLAVGQGSWYYNVYDIILIVFNSFVQVFLLLAIVIILWESSQLIWQLFIF